MSPAKTMNPFEKLHRGIALLDSGDGGGAAKLFKEAGEAGLAEGYLELASQAAREGKKNEAEQWVLRMEDIAASNDADELTHMSCHMAYEFNLGSGSPEQQEARARDHLQRAAELGNSTAQAFLAGRYRSGTGGFARDAALYEYWMSKAIDQGDDHALCSYVERMKKGWPRCISRASE